eukprot:6197588-Pleurochrysis_carterae.AAC.4
MPTQARGSMRVLLYATRGLTANAPHPNGSVGIMHEIPPRGGPVVRLRTSTKCATAKVQKEVGVPLATRLARVSSITLRIARSATPFNWCTCGGQVVEWTPLRANSSVKCRERNSPALSLCIVPTTRVGVSRPELRRAVKLARNGYVRRRLMFMA